MIHTSNDRFRKNLLILIFSIIAFQCFPQNYNHFYDQAEIEFKNRNYYQAAQFYEQSHEFIPNVSEITFKLAQSLLFAHNYEKALVYFTEVITKSPGKYPMAYFYQAELQKMLGKYSDAMSSYKYYFHFFTDSSEFVKKAQNQVPSCDFAIKNNSVQPINITKVSEPVNTFFSEINIAEFGDSTLLYSALTPNVDSTQFVAKMFFSKHIYNYETLIRRINETKTNVIDLTLSPDQNTAFFCACVDTNHSSDFKIYKCVFDSMQWRDPELLPDHINLYGYKSTQPFFTKINGKDYLFYVSDRPGGQGNLDIWYSQWLYNRFLKPINLGIEVNTIGDDITPYYDTLNNQLYFSSEMHKGYGGFDVFTSKGIPGSNWSSAVNVGLPINSSFNEVYFTISQNRKRSYFTSDRTPVKIDKDNYYFNDFYWFKNNLDTTKSLAIKDSIKIATASKLPKTVNVESKPTNTIKQFESKPNLEFQLYFNHNEPLLEDEKIDYSKLLKSYSIDQSAELKITEINKAFDDFNKSLDNIINNINSLNEVVIQLKAYTSPTGSQQYNIQLAQRRINSIVNYIKSFHSGELAKYLETKIQINIQTPEIPINQGLDNKEETKMASLRKVNIIISTK